MHTVGVRRVLNQNLTEEIKGSIIYYGTDYRKTVEPRYWGDMLVTADPEVFAHWLSSHPPKLVLAELHLEAEAAAILAHFVHDVSEALEHDAEKLNADIERLRKESTRDWRHGG